MGIFLDKYSKNYLKFNYNLDSIQSSKNKSQIKV